MKSYRYYLLCFVSLFLILSFVTCSSKSDNSKKTDTLPIFTNVGWYMKFTDTPIDDISITNGHAFASSDVGLLHFYPLSKNVEHEIVIPIKGERCINHAVSSGTDSERVPISRYLYAENNKLFTYDLYCNSKTKNVEAKKSKSISLNNWESFTGGNNKFNFTIDTSSQTTAISLYSNLLFIDKNFNVSKYSLYNYSIEDSLNGSTYYYLSKNPENLNIVRFSALNMDSKKFSWEYDPCVQKPFLCQISDSSFEKALQNIFVFFRSKTESTHSILIQSFSNEGTILRTKSLSKQKSSSLPVSQIFTFFYDNKTILVGEMFNEGTIECINADTFESSWELTIKGNLSILDMTLNSEGNKLFALLEDGSVISIDLTDGLITDDLKIIEDDTSTIYSYGGFRYLDNKLVGYLNNTNGTPFRSLFFLCDIEN
ncbi:MAG: hypothetical protein KAH01_02330 [Caldisericia bacterium]|nr:hypothetical protein [Caldisericia bacterium]